MWVRRLKLTKSFCASKEPKWLRFFQSSRPIEISADRSLLNPPSEHLTSIIKQQQGEYSVEYLIRSADKIQRSNLLDQILQNIEKHIIGEQYYFLDKPSILVILDSNKFSDYIRKYLHPLVAYNLARKADEFSTSELLKVLAFLKQEGLESPEFQNKIVQMAQEIEENNQLHTVSVKDLINYFEILQDQTPLKQTFENQLLYLLNDDQALKENIKALMRLSNPGDRIKSIIKEALVNVLNPLNIGTWILTQEDELRKDIIKYLLSERIKPSEAGSVQEILNYLTEINITGNQQQVLDIFRIMKKFNTINFEFITDSLRQNRWMDYSDRQRLVEMLEITENLGYAQLKPFQKLTARFQSFYMTALQDNTKDQLENQIKSVLEQKKDDKTLDQETFKQIKGLIEKQGKFNITRTLTIMDNDPRKHLLSRIELMRCGLQQNEQNGEEQIKITESDKVVLKSKWFTEFTNNFGLISNFAENLMYICAHQKLELKPVQKIQERLQKILGGSPNIDELKKQIEQGYMNNKVEVDSKLHLFDLSQKVFDPEVVDMSTGSYLCKAIKTPMLRKLLNQSPLKQVVAQSLADKGWRKDYVEYPAMADFVNLNDKVAIFVIDAVRLQYGWNDFPDWETRFSQSYFRLKGFKIVNVTYKMYSVHRNKVWTSIKKEL